MTVAPGTDATPSVNTGDNTLFEYVDPLDDVFGSSPPSPTVNTSDPPPSHAPAEPSDIPRLRSTHVTSGYREGIAASKDQHIQAGFDEGYSLGAEIGMRVGWCLGVLEGICKALTAGAKRDEMVKLREEAERELKVEKVFGREYFGEDGVWLFGIAVVEGKEENVSFAEVANAHPLVSKWVGVVRRLAEELGLLLNGL